MRNNLMNPRQSPTTHTEQLGDEASVYDWARAQGDNDGDGEVTISW